MDVVDSAKLKEQRDSLAAKQTVPLVCVSDNRKCGRFKKSATTGQEYHTVDHLEKEGRRKRQRSTIYIQSTADGTTVNRTSKLLPVQR